MPANAASEESTDGRRTPHRRRAAGRARVQRDADPGGARTSRPASRSSSGTGCAKGSSRVRDVGDARAPRGGERARARGARGRRVSRRPPRTTRPKCPFRRIEATPADEVAAVLASCARTQPLLVATALCHLGATYRVGGLEPPRSRASGRAVRPTLESDPRAVGDPHRDVRARSTRPDRAPPLTQRAGRRRRARRCAADVDVGELVDRRASDELELLHRARTRAPRRTRGSRRAPRGSPRRTARSRGRPARPSPPIATDTGREHDARRARCARARTRSRA